MSIEIRPATDAERERCVHWWVRSLAGRTPVSERDGIPWVDVGRGQMSGPRCVDMLRGYLRDDRFHWSSFDVAVLAGEPLGFVSYAGGCSLVEEPYGFSVKPEDRRHLHYIFVTGEARRKGLGTMLFRHAVNSDYTPTFMTRAGRALEEHALRLIAAEQSAASQ